MVTILLAVDALSDPETDPEQPHSPSSHTVVSREAFIISQSKKIKIKTYQERL